MRGSKKHKPNSGSLGRQRPSRWFLGLFIAAFVAIGGIIIFTSFAATPPISNIKPTVSITAPANNSYVKGTISVSANATDDHAVTSVQFKLNGNNLGNALTSAPYIYSW